MRCDLTVVLPRLWAGCVAAFVLRRLCCGVVQCVHGCVRYAGWIACIEFPVCVIGQKAAMVLSFPAVTALLLSAVLPLALALGFSLARTLGLLLLCLAGRLGCLGRRPAARSIRTAALRRLGKPPALVPTSRTGCRSCGGATAAMRGGDSVRWRGCGIRDTDAAAVVIGVAIVIVA